MHLYGMTDEVVNWTKQGWFSMGMQGMDLNS